MEHVLGPKWDFSTLSKDEGYERTVNPYITNFLLNRISTGFLASLEIVMIEEGE
jgi:hypothetical protein